MGWIEWMEFLKEFAQRSHFQSLWRFPFPQLFQLIGEEVTGSRPSEVMEIKVLNIFNMTSSLVMEPKQQCNSTKTCCQLTLQGKQQWDHHIMLHHVAYSWLNSSCRASFTQTWGTTSVYFNMLQVVDQKLLLKLSLWQVKIRALLGPPADMDKKWVKSRFTTASIGASAAMNHRGAEQEKEIRNSVRC